MIVFLDFDGILHPDAAYLVNGRPELRAEGELFMWCGHLVDVLSERPDVRIVLSTSWARHLGFTAARDYLPQSVANRVIGATWHSAMALGEGLYSSGSRLTWWDLVARYEQIARWVSRYEQRHGAFEWIAVDDDDRNWPENMRHRLVHANPDLGLSEPETRAALRRGLALPAVGLKSSHRP